jgi:hypothetical protein
MEFPDPPYADLPRNHALASILMSFPLCFLKVAQLRERAFSAYAALFELGVNSPEADSYHPSDFRVTGNLKVFVETGSTTWKQVAFSPVIGASVVERLTQTIDLLQKSIGWYRDRLNAPLRGDEFVGRGMRWRDSATPSREIAQLAIEEYEIVLRAIESFGRPVSGPPFDD